MIHVKTKNQVKIKLNLKFNKFILPFPKKNLILSG